MRKVAEGERIPSPFCQEGLLQVMERSRAAAKKRARSRDIDLEHCNGFPFQMKLGQSRFNLARVSAFVAPIQTLGLRDAQEAHDA